MEHGIIETARNAREWLKTGRAVVAGVLVGAVTGVGLGLGWAIRDADLSEYKRQAAVSMSASDGVVTSIKADSDLCIAEMTGSSTGTAEIKYHEGLKTNVDWLDWLIKNGSSGSVKVTFNENKDTANDTTILICLDAVDLTLKTRERERGDKPTLEIEVPLNALKAKVLQRGFSMSSFTPSTTGWGSFEAQKSAFVYSFDAKSMPALKKDGQTFYQGLFNIASGLSRMTAQNVIRTQCVKAALAQETDAANVSQSSANPTSTTGPLTRALADGLTAIYVKQFNSMNPTSVSRYGAIASKNVSVKFTGDGKLTTINEEAKEDTEAIVSNVKQQLTDLNLVPEVNVPDPSEAKCIVKPGVYSEKAAQQKVTDQTTGTNR